MNETSRISSVSYIIYNNDAYSETTAYAYDGNTYRFPDPPTKKEISSIIERLFDKGKYFRFRTSMEYRRWFGEPPLPVEVKTEKNLTCRRQLRGSSFRSSTYQQFGRFRSRARTR